MRHSPFALPTWARPIAATTRASGRPRTLLRAATAAAALAATVIAPARADERQAKAAAHVTIVESDGAIASRAGADGVTRRGTLVSVQRLDAAAHSPGPGGGVLLVFN